MPSNRLNIVSVENNSPSEVRTFRPKTNREAVQTRFEKIWESNPSKFDPMKECMGRERMARTLQLIQKSCPPKGKKAADLGCASGTLSRKLRDCGSNVTAVDVAKNALDAFRNIDANGIRLVHDCVPHTRLNDGDYGLIVCTELIGSLPPREHRLFFSEMARLLNRDGCLICSTPIDIHSEDALDRLASLAETELEIVDWKFSYHRWFIKLLDILKAPRRFARARKDPEYREAALNRRVYLARWWFKLNSSAVIGDSWTVFRFLSDPLYNLVRQSHSVMRLLEKACRIAVQDRGISHVIFAAKRRPFYEEPPPAPPTERKTKKMVWE